MTTLYYALGACSLAPHIVLEWIGAPYEAVKVQYGSKELLAVNGHYKYLYDLQFKDDAGNQ